MRERYDVIFLFNKLVEFDKLKQVLLSENQKKLFNIMPQPIININENYENDQLGENN